MPLEVTPIPFPDQQLPYTPKFVPVEIQGLPTRSLARGSGGGGGSSNGDSASAVIPPGSGGIASPHRAIPALSEAGYTAPGQARSFAGSRMEAKVGGYGDSGSAFGNSAFGAGSAYASSQGNAPNYGPGTMSMGYSEAGWAPASLPAPRRASASMPLRPAIGTVIPSEAPIAPPREYPGLVGGGLTRHHSHHHTDIKSPRERNALEDDARSDGSYYARPRLHRHRSSTSRSSSAGDASPRTPHSRRAGSISNRTPQRSPPQLPVHNTHSPISPSPLGRDPKRSPLVVNANRHRRASDADSNPPRYRDGQAYGDAEDDRGGRRHSMLGIPESSRSDGGTVAPAPGTLQARGASRHARYHGRRRSDAGADHTEYRDENGIEDEHGLYKRLNRLSLHDNGATAPGQTRHRSHSHVPSPVRAASPVPVAPLAPSPPQAPHIYVNATSLATSGHSYQRTRRRAQSLQGLEQPVQLSNPYQAPSVFGLGPLDAYDDGGSIAGSAMTFMDGSVGGRVSQYGLPKYAHQPKMDYRRFCVQRGNADVFLD